MSLSARVEKLSPREQRLLGILGAVLGLLLFIGIPVYVYMDVASARARNDEIRKQLRNMEQASQLLAQRSEERLAREQLYARPAPALASFIEGAARAQGIEVPESSDQPDIVGKELTERSTQVKLRKVGLKALVKTLEQMEQAGHPVAVTRLRITARSTPDEYDVTLAVSAYDKKAQGEAVDKKPGRTPGSSPPRMPASKSKGQPR